MTANYQLFPELVSKQIQHLFTLRQKHFASTRENLAHLLRACQFPHDQIVEAEQTHGSQVAVVDQKHRHTTVPIVDGLITQTADLSLVIRAADCGPLYFFDPTKKVIAVAHSGKKGTEQNILKQTVMAMVETYQSEISHILCVLGPCIRPPLYEVDIAKKMAAQAQEIGLHQFYDCMENTGADLNRFYSYRMEKGNTERHFAVLRLRSEPQPNLACSKQESL
ncbi:MAG: laccase domain-containing protein [Verrucomicrobiota bacterium]